MKKINDYEYDIQEIGEAAVVYNQYIKLTELGMWWCKMTYM